MGNNVVPKEKEKEKKNGSIRFSRRSIILSESSKPNNSEK